MQRAHLWPLLLLGAVALAAVFFLLPGRSDERDAAPALLAPPGGALVSFAGAMLRAEIASTSAARAKGLSGRAALPEGEAMLFLFDEPSSSGMWMKDMRFPIDIAWFDEAHRAIHLVSRADPSSFPQVFAPPVPAASVLELPAGFLEAHSAVLGDRFEIVRP